MPPTRWVAAVIFCAVVCLIARLPLSRQAADSTAQGVALMRGVGWHSADSFLRIDDPASLCFVSRSARMILSSALGASTIRTVAGYMVPGAYEQVIYRTRHYDQLITDSVANGARQVVIMGAGYVTYGHRLKAVVEQGVPVFELDLPAIQEQKLARLETCVADGLLTRNSAVRHTPIDFAVQTVGDALREAGFDVTLPSVFVWEGVSMYVPEAGVRETLRSVRSVAARGSVLGFSYIFREMVEQDGMYEPSACPEAIPFMKQAKSKGEPWLFGIGTCTAESNSTELESLLQEHGFALKHALTAEAAEQTYFMRDGSVALRIPRRLVQEAVAVVGSSGSGMS